MRIDMIPMKIPQAAIRAKPDIARHALNFLGISSSWAVIGKLFQLPAQEFYLVSQFLVHLHFVLDDF
jgi:hypothetical protein